jgi:hypothetical protein
MIRLIALPFVLVLLTAADCSQTLERTITQVTTGNPPVQFVALEQESNRAWEEEVVVEVVPEPEPPRCDNWIWRGVEYDCHGNWVRDL